MRVCLRRRQHFHTRVVQDGKHPSLKHDRAKRDEVDQPCVHGGEDHKRVATRPRRAERARLARRLPTRLCDLIDAAHKGQGGAQVRDSVVGNICRQRRLQSLPVVRGLHDLLVEQRLTDQAGARSPTTRRALPLLLPLLYGRERRGSHAHPAPQPVPDDSAHTGNSESVGGERGRPTPLRARGGPRAVTKGGGGGGSPTTPPDVEYSAEMRPPPTPWVSSAALSAGRHLCGVRANPGASDASVAVTPHTAPEPPPRGLQQASCRRRPTDVDAAGPRRVAAALLRLPPAPLAVGCPGRCRRGVKALNGCRAAGRQRGHHRRDGPRREGDYRRGGGHLRGEGKHCGGGRHHGGGHRRGWGGGHRRG